MSCAPQPRRTTSKTANRSARVRRRAPHLQGHGRERGAGPQRLLDQAVGYDLASLAVSCEGAQDPRVHGKELKDVRRDLHEIRRTPCAAHVLELQTGAGSMPWLPNSAEARVEHSSHTCHAATHLGAGEHPVHGVAELVEERADVREGELPAHVVAGHDEGRRLGLRRANLVPAGYKHAPVYLIAP